MDPYKNLNDSDIENAGRPALPTPQPLGGNYPNSNVPISQDKPKDPYKWFKAAIIIGILVSVAILAMAAVLYIAQSSVKKTDTTANNTQAEHIEPITAQQTIDHIAAYFKGKEKPRSAINIPVKANGEAFYTVIPDKTDLKSIAGFVDPEKSTAQRDSIEKSLVYDKFTRKVFLEGVNNTNYLADFTRDDVVCQLSVEVAERDTAGDWVEIRCLDTSDYSAYATAQKPLVSAYTSVVSTAAQYGFVGKPVSKNGAITGYKLVEITASSVTNQRMTTTDNLALFYQSPDGVWHYFRDRNKDILVECENYNSEALRRAYADQPCRERASGAIKTVTYSGKRS